MNLDLTDAVIESERLRLVPVSSEYREDIFREFTDDITIYMNPPTPKDISETDAFIEKSQKERIEGTDLTLAITNKETGEFIGCCGIHKINTATPEFGIWTKKSSHGNKYGREAIAALKAWADTNLHCDYYKYPVAKVNPASRKIPEALGGTVALERLTKNGRGDTLDLVEYHIPR